MRNCGGSAGIKVDDEGEEARLVLVWNGCISRFNSLHEANAREYRFAGSGKKLRERTMARVKRSEERTFESFQ